MKMYMARREKAQAGDRIFRESSTMRAAESVWSDVASEKGMGFRSGNGGPLLYGDLPSGGEVEFGLFETNYSDVYCTVATVRGREDKAKKGTVSVRPHDLGTKLLEVFGRPELPADFLQAFFVKAKPVAIAGVVLGEEARAMLLEQTDRAPRYFYEDGSSTLVLEGIELVHERIGRIVEALSAIDAAAHG
jgi:hypothetical protein